MPYVNQDIRALHKDTIAHFKAFHGHCAPGELNYLLTALCHAYIETHGLNYGKINDVIGVLECAKQEFYRMVAAKYEDKKRDENGAVSDLDERSLENVR